MAGSLAPRLNAVLNAMVGSDFSLQGGLAAAFVLLALNRKVAFLRLRGILWGRPHRRDPSVLVEDGELIEPHLPRKGLLPAGGDRTGRCGLGVRAAARAGPRADA